LERTVTGGFAIADGPLAEAHRHCSIHRDEINTSAICGCFYCLEIFPPQDIIEWLNDRIHGLDGQTALCPQCGIDSVIGAASGYPISREFLQAMRSRWFEK
jgi:hypothetical protein